MFRFTRPLFQVVKQTTGITGLAVHPDPLPELSRIYQSTLSALETIPATSVYRQGVESLVKHKLNIVQKANGDIAAVERELNEGQIEQSLDIASDELSLVSKMFEWKAWEPLTEKPEPGQWEYIQ
ncbi:ETC complex I subunit conserved region-domain-containing protein [Mycena floridula]|nr:ETC complex I subunit conserved region-domain-containing protein [Mycena floridula]